MSLKDKIGEIIGLIVLSTIALCTGMVVVMSLIYGGSGGETVGCFIVSAICSFLAYSNIKDLVSAAKKTSWKIVQPNSPIVKFESEPVHRTRNKSFYISTVYYADGFEFVSTKTEYSNFRPSGLGRQSYTMSVNKEAICQEAQKAHNAAVRKKYRKTGGKL